MRTLCRVVCICAVFGLTGGTLAAESTAPNAQSLGTFEAILDKCAELDAAHAAEYRDQLHAVTQGASEEAIAKLRDSDDYKEAYTAARNSLGKVAGPDALKACKGSLAPGQ
jgi:hypothetical protein